MGIVLFINEKNDAFMNENNGKITSSRNLVVMYVSLDRSHILQSNKRA